MNAIELTPGAALVRRAFKAGLTRPRDQSVSAWAAENRILPAENSAFAGAWSNETAPYLTAIMDACGHDQPHERVTVKKSAQVGYSEALTNILGAMIELAPGPALMVHPTVDGAKNWIAEKLEPTIAVTPSLRARVRTVIQRDGEGSTTKRKRFASGFLIVTGANSTRELRQRSVRSLYKDEWSDWPLDVSGQGDPDAMAEARTLGFQSSGLVRIVQGSTPTIKGACRVSAAYEQSDRRVYKVPCPFCAWEQELRFFPDRDGRGGFRFAESGPVAATYECEACGERIEHQHKRDMVAAGKWEATNPEGTHPGFHVWSAYSPFTTWDRIAQRYLAARGDSTKLKAFYNLDLGLEWEERGEAPDHQALAARAEDYPTGRVPAGALLVTVGCDVQAKGIYYEVVAWGPNSESWSIDAGFIAGDTGDTTSEAWRGLDALYRARYPIAGGEALECDLMAIDANYNTDQVCDWVRTKPHAMAVRGVDGWNRAAIGTPTKTDVTFGGARKKRSAKIWPVHVWSLKGALYADLRKQPEPGAEAVPPAYCHFPRSYPATYYAQLTADYVRDVERKGRIVRVWTSRGENHFHDCRIYNMAAHRRVLQRFNLHNDDAAAWSRLTKERRPGGAQGELVLDAAVEDVAPAVPVPSEEPAAHDDAPRKRAPWPSAPRRPRNWVNRWH